LIGERGISLKGAQPMMVFDWVVWCRTVTIHCVAPLYRVLIAYFALLSGGAEWGAMVGS